MRLFDALLRVWNAPSAAELARQVAQRSYGLVRESVEGRTAGMGRAEARGYVRAKAGPVIRSQLASLLSRVGRLDAHAQAVVYVQASDRVIQSVLADLSRQRARQADARRAA